MESIDQTILITIVLVIIVFVGTLCGINLIRKKRIHEQEQKDYQQLIEAFKQKIPSLANNYSPIWLISMGKSKNPQRTFNVLDKIIKYTDNTTIINWWNKFSLGYESWDEAKYRNKSKDFLTILADCGLMCCGVEVTVAPDNFDDLFDYTEDITKGSEVEVIMPYWRYNGKIIELGYIKKVN